MTDIIPGLTTIIWDWNGTLLDDAWLCVAVMNDMLRSRGLPELSAGRYQEIFDFPVECYYQRAGFDFSREPFRVLGSEFMVAYERRRGACRLQPGALDALDYFRASGLRQFILSAYKHESLLEAVEAHGIARFFDHLAGIDDHYARGKIGQGLALMQTHRLSPAETLLIGDTTHDHEVASAMGVGCRLVVSGNHSFEKLHACGVPVFASLPDLLATLDA